MQQETDKTSINYENAQLGVRKMNHKNHENEGEGVRCSAQSGLHKIGDGCSVICDRKDRRMETSNQ